MTSGCDVNGILFDMGEALYNSDRLIRGAVEAVERLRRPPQESGCVPTATERSRHLCVPQRAMSSPGCLAGRFASLHHNPDAQLIALG